MNMKYKTNTKSCDLSWEINMKYKTLEIRMNIQILLFVFWKLGVTSKKLSLYFLWQQSLRSWYVFGKIIQLCDLFLHCLSWSSCVQSREMGEAMLTRGFIPISTETQSSDFADRLNTERTLPSSRWCTKTKRTKPRAQLFCSYSDVDKSVGKKSKWKVNFQA